MFITNTLLGITFLTFSLVFGNVVRHGLSTITCTYNTFWHYHIHCYAFAGKPFSKQLYNSANAEPKSTIFWNVNLGIVSCSFSSLKLLAEYS